VRGRWPAIALLAGVSALAGCLAPPAPGDEAELPAAPGSPAARPLILIALPASLPAPGVLHSLVEELQEDFDVATVLVGPGPGPRALAEAIERQRPRAVVAVDRPALTLYEGFARAHPHLAPPAVAIMASFLEEPPTLASTTGIACEVPGVTAFVQLRSVIARPVRRVAVVHRPGARAFIERQVPLAAREQIALLPIAVSSDPGPAEVVAALALVRQAQPDALWVLDDGDLLADALLEAAWRPEIERLGVPVVVGRASLAAAEARFGTFAVVPDPEALGVQTAQLVTKLAASGWRADKHPIEPPISTVTIANLARLQRQFGLRPGAAERVDRAVE
jgi:hypothetical protein